MIEIGKLNELRATHREEFGLYLTDGQQNVLLPRKFVPRDIQIGDTMEVFVYTDSEDRPVATTQRPKGQAGEFAAMVAKEVTPVGAFMDWGLDKDLLVPFAEQRGPVREGRTYVVRVVFDERSSRVIGSTKLSRYLGPTPVDLRDGAKLNGLIADINDDGAWVILEGAFGGMIFHEDLRERLRIGDKREVFVKRVRQDGAVALSLTPVGYEAVEGLAPKILARLKKEGGFLPFTDKSSPDEIQRVFGVSKGTFKKAVGALLKAGEIELEYHGMRLRDQDRR